MPTERTIFNSIMQEYEDRRTVSAQTVREHTAKVYAAVPEYKSLDDEIADISESSVRSFLSGNADAASKAHERIAAISVRKKTLLSENGFPADYLDVRYTCPDCKDTGYIGTEKCHCLKQRLIDIRYFQSNIMEKLSSENFDTFSFDYFDGEALSEIKRAYNASLDFTEKFASEYNNMLFYGNVGCGKTFLTNCIAKALLDKGFSVVYLSAFQLFAILNTHTFDSKNEDDDGRRNYDSLFVSDLLIIDDLGTEIMSSAVSSGFFQILNERGLRHRSTVISTNLSLGQLRDNYSERSLSRILGNFSLYKFSGADIRIKKARKS